MPLVPRLPPVPFLLALAAPALAAQGPGEVVVLATAGRHLASGATVSTGWLGGAAVRFGFERGGLAVGPELMVQNGDRHRVRGLSAVARLSQARGAVRPFLVAGTGPYVWRERIELGLPELAVVGAEPVWREVTAWSASVGAGITSRRRAVQWLAELRWHRTLSAGDDGASRALLSLAGGLRVGW